MISLSDAVAIHSLPELDVVAYLTTTRGANLYARGTSREGCSALQTSKDSLCTNTMVTENWPQYLPFCNEDAGCFYLFCLLGTSAVLISWLVILHRLHRLGYLVVWCDFCTGLTSLS